MRLSKKFNPLLIINKSLPLLTLFALTIGSIHYSPATQANNELPSIGATTSSGILESETKLGQAWLKQFRNSVSLYADPIVTAFTEQLLYSLGAKVKLGESDLSMVIVNNKELNAFAVPGGIIGIHTGLYQYAETEAQFASVIAHELAHLTQRHYARNLERQKSRQFANMAALLAGLLLISSNQGDVGTAALSTAQAAIIDESLSFSRLFEEEADNIGIKILEESGYPMSAMSEMFEHMQRASRYSSTPPEFLLTHPVTAKRIASTKERARQSMIDETGINRDAKRDNTQDNDYALIRARVLLAQMTSNQQAINHFRNEIRGFSPSLSASRYGLMLSLIKDKQFEAASTELNILLESKPKHPLMLIAQSDILASTGSASAAHSLIDEAIADPNNTLFLRALNTQKSLLYAAEERFKEATEALVTLSEAYPNDPSLWYQLSEFSGLAGDILRLHKSRTEFFILFGRFSSAEEQLENIIKKYKNQPVEVSYAKARIEDIKQMKEDAKF